ncbi:YihY/virulence factor BrkB family protein [Thermoleophilum album]|uniref:YihY/virulence factor BrkB family protein n=1 Tax=Thermoleophilum album TaxID=29539 RepID=UPI00237CC4F3|nr:YihY/virulence factor BrkB family protein [Thermoleophilum album]WDT93292.1 YihY/virulence factor BrkB family protein [Thermoleophilum album]
MSAARRRVVAVPHAVVAAAKRAAARAAATRAGRAGVVFQERQLPDAAAALTYYAMLALAPGLLVVASALSLVGEATAEQLVARVRELAPGPAADVLDRTLGDLRSAPVGAGITAAVAVGAAVWSASSYVEAFRRAATRAAGLADGGEPVLRAAVARLLRTLVLALLLALAALLVALTGDVARALGRLLGTSDAVLTAWSFARWALLAIVTVATVTYLYGTAGVLGGSLLRPSRGALVAVAVWLAASVAFSLYVSGPASYGRTYGALAGIVVFLVWLWLSNVALLFGVAYEASGDKQRAQVQQRPADT